jgi:dTDP-4-dehydrorhamnose reductase
VNILVIGRHGQVARAVARLGGGVAVAARPELDLKHPESVARAIALRRPDIVINLAAFTAVDRAESERELAFAVNAAGAGAVAEAAAQCGAAVIHISTDYVFAGDKTSAYTEEDATDPRCVYGASKLEGERLVLAANPRALILRTSWVFDAQGANFVRTMLRLARSRASIGVVADQAGCPTFAGDLAAAISAIAEKLGDGGPGGIYHCAGAGATTWADFAIAIFALSQARGGPFAEIVRIRSSEFPTPAPRPANSVLNCKKLLADYGIELPSWRSSLAACMDEIEAGGWSVE